jgi:hypothetical protein
MVGFAGAARSIISVSYDKAYTKAGAFLRGFSDSLSTRWNQTLWTVHHVISQWFLSEHDTREL